MSDSTPGKNLRILIIPDKYLPDECAGGAVYTDMCRGLVERGMDVTVRCPYPFYPEWTDKSGRNGWRIDRSVEDGVNVERYGFFIPNNPRKAWQRMLLDATFFASLTRSIFSGGKFDAVIALCPHMGGVAFGSLYKFLHRRPLCVSVMDMPADAAKATGINRSGMLHKVLAGVQSFLFNRGDVWRSISPAMIEKLHGLTKHQQPVMFIPDWLHPSLAAELTRLSSKVGRPPASPIKLLYSGNIGTKQGLLEFCKVIQKTSSSFEFRIQGGGGNAGVVREWVEASGDPRFSFHDLSDEAGFARALHETDFYVVTEKANIGSSFFPSKTIPGMMSGTPILAISDPQSPLGREVRLHDLGPWFSWDQCDDLGKMLDSVQGTPERFAAWQRNCLQRGLFFERERCLDLIEDLLKDMASDRGLAQTRAKAITQVSPTLG